MQTGLKLDGTMRAVVLAIGAAIVTSVISMLVPVGIWETITGSTGISELVPATAAPLGDTARALIAFLCGLAAFAVTAVWQMRKPVHAEPPKYKAESEAVVEDGPTFFERTKAKLGEFAAKRRGDNIVTELSDLPKLRAGDAHPDAPPRRPILATRDFADPAPEPEMPVEAPVEMPVAEPVAVPAAEPVVANSVKVADMVTRLEAAMMLREQQLAQLEAIARVEAAKPQPIVPEKVEAEIVEPAPRLEAVPSDPAKHSGGDEMDAALRSALETLHRMNARTR